MADEPLGFDRRIIPDETLGLVRACQRRVACTLGGGAALGGAYLGHRLSNDIDLFLSNAADVPLLARGLPELARAAGATYQPVQESPTFVRAAVTLGQGQLVIDVVHDTSPTLEAAPTVEGVRVESLVDLRAAKLTCILSRAEPRDLVDLLFLDREGFPPEADLPLALEKDAGTDPGVLAWLLRDFPLQPLPRMLLPLDADELEQFRDALCERMRRAALPG
jgi:hypothetical protein